MKKVFIVLALGAFVASCGKSACDCKKEAEELIKKSFAGEDEKKEIDQSEEDRKDYSEDDLKDCDQFDEIKKSQSMTSFFYVQ